MSDTNDKLDRMAGSIVMLEGILTALVNASPERDNILAASTGIVVRLQRMAEEMEMRDPVALQVHKAMMEGAAQTLKGVTDAFKP